MPLILASASEQRKTLLAQIGVIPDKIYPSAIDEKPLQGELPTQTAKRLAHMKACAAREKFPHDFILAADTVIACGRRILDKPTDAQEARAHLLLLSGRAHHAYTALCLLTPDGRTLQRLSDSHIRFKRLSGQEIATYIKSNQWQGCAGGYHIYGMAESFIRRINGSASGIAGLPLFETAQMLHGVGLR